jgi:tRNA nucleotidyltransferase (CCA-adding enzyme)
LKLAADNKAVLVCQELRSASFEAWLVGGEIRDLLIARESRDCGIETNSQPAVSAERIRDEFVKGVMSQDPEMFLNLLLESGMLSHVVPEMMAMPGMQQNKYHEFDVWTHTCKVVAATPACSHLRLAAVFHDIAKPSTKGQHPNTGEVTFYGHEEAGAEMACAIMERLKFSNNDRDNVAHLIRHHLVPTLRSAASVRRWVRRVGRENVDSILALSRADVAGKGKPRELGTTLEYLDEIQNQISELEVHVPIVTRASRLAVTGNDVMVALDIGPGPGVGAKLRELLGLVTDDPSLNERDILMAELARRRNR